MSSTSEDSLRKMVLEDPVIFPRQITGNVVPQEIKKLISKLLIKSQDGRLKSFQELKCDAVFAVFDWVALEERRLRAPLIPSSQNPTCNFDPSFTTYPAKIAEVTEDINPNINTAFDDFDEVFVEQ